MENIYFNPGCALSIYKPGMEHRFLDWLKKDFPAIESHKICCLHEPKLEKGSVIINVCAGCDRRFRTLYEGITTFSLWEALDRGTGFPFPDYQGTKMSVQDACPIREKPQVHSAVRSLLRKMNIEIIENERHGTRSVCCGDDLYPSLPLTQVHKHMKSRADSMPCEDVVVYCVSCIKSMYIGGKKPRHLIDLLFREATTPDVYDTVEWHNQLQSYIDAH